MKKSLLLLLVAMFSLTGCGSTNNPNTPNTPETNEEGGGNKQQEEGSGNKESEFTALLNYIKNNEKYRRYVNALNDGRLKASSAAFDSHPCSFIQTKGGNIEYIESGFSFAFTKTYTLANEPNVLYMFTRFADTENSYFKEYHLRYVLTEKEMAEYRSIHERRVLEACFMNDAVAATRQPTILSECLVSVEAHNKINSDINDLYSTQRMIGKYGTDMTFKNFNQDTQKFEVYIYPNAGFGNPKTMIKEHKLGQYTFICNFQEMQVINGIYCGPTSYENFIIDSSVDKEHIEQYAVDVTWYTSQYAEFLSDGPIF